MSVHRHLQEQLSWIFSEGAGTFKTMKINFGLSFFILNCVVFHIDFELLLFNNDEEEKYLFAIFYDGCMRHFLIKVSKNNCGL